MARRKNGISPKLEHVAILPEDKKKIRRRAANESKFQYEVVQEALNFLEKSVQSGTTKRDND
jgi:hypothetical protein